MRNTQTPVGNSVPHPRKDMSYGTEKSPPTHCPSFKGIEHEK